MNIVQIAHSTFPVELVTSLFLNKNICLLFGCRCVASFFFSSLIFRSINQKRLRIKHRKQNSKKKINICLLMKHEIHKNHIRSVCWAFCRLYIATYGWNKQASKQSNRIRQTNFYLRLLFIERISNRNIHASLLVGFICEWLIIIIKRWDEQNRSTECQQ